MNEYLGLQFGNYRLIRVLGRGSFADVYLGEHIHLKTLAAVKILHVRLSSNNLEDFSKEAQIIAHLDHPHIVKILDFDVQENIPFLVMSYASNGSLRERHAPGSILPLETVVPYVKDAASALDYAHASKLLHRDIKPENMLLARNNDVLLSDFGIAIVQSTRDQTMQQVTGTVAYMSPEQIQGKPCPASDQYALGIVTYEWLSGARPFKGGFTELCAQHIYAPPPPLSGAMQSVSLATEAVVMQALEKEPNARYANVGEFAKALELSFREPTPYSPGPIIRQPPYFPPGNPGYSGPPSSFNPSFSSDATVPDTTFQADNRDPNVYPFDTQTTTPRPGKRLKKKMLAILIVCLVVLLAVVGLYTYPLIVKPQTTAKSQAAPSLQYGINAQRTRFNTDEHSINTGNVSRLVEKWMITTGGKVESSPVVVSGIVYVGSNDSHLYAFNAGTGTLVWKASPSSGNWILSTPAVANGIIYAGSFDGNLYALNQKSGAILWKAVTNNSIESSPVVVNGIVYIGSDDSYLYAFDATTGTFLWREFTGNSVLSSPSVSNGIVYVGSINGKLYAFNAKTGVLVWTSPIVGIVNFSSPAIANGVVYIGSNDSYLYALDAKSGIPLWKTKTGDKIESSPAVANGVVYIGSDDSYLYAFDAKTGAELWKTATTGSIFSSPMVANGVVYAGSIDQSIYAFDAKTGKTLWEAQTGSSIHSSPEVANGILYIGSDDHKLYAFHLSGT